MKGKTYTEALSRIYSPALLPVRVKDYTLRLLSLFDEYSISNDQVKAVLKVCRETEFSGTSYMPLPDEAALIKIIKQIKEKETLDRQYADVVDECRKYEFQDGVGKMICPDGEVIIRDAYFFRSMLELLDVMNWNYPMTWLEECVYGMTEEYVAKYRAAPDRPARIEVMREYYNGLDLPMREEYDHNECDKMRESHGQWSRYK